MTLLGKGYHIGAAPLQTVSNHKDTGCNLKQRCLSCSLSKCKYDMTAFELSVARRNAEIQEMRSAGYEFEYIAKHFDLSVRSIYRVIEASESIDQVSDRPVIKLSHCKKPRKRHRQVVKYATRVYFASCRKCSTGAVQFGYDSTALANTARCLQCGWTVIGKVLVK